MTAGRICRTASSDHTLIRSHAENEQVTLNYTATSSFSLYMMVLDWACLLYREVLQSAASDRGPGFLDSRIATPGQTSDFFNVWISKSS